MSKSGQFKTTVIFGRADVSEAWTANRPSGAGSKVSIHPPEILGAANGQMIDHHTRMIEAALAQSRGESAVDQILHRDLQININDTRL